MVVLRILSFSSFQEKPLYSKSDVENIVGQKVQTALLALLEAPRRPSLHEILGTSGPYRNHKASASRKMQKKRFGRAPQDMCYHCGYTSHTRGDDECPSPCFITKKLRSQSPSAGGLMPNSGDPKRLRSKPRTQPPTRSHPFPKGYTALKRKNL